MGFIEFEAAGKRVLERFPGLKHAIKRVYQVVSEPQAGIRQGQREILPVSLWMMVMSISMVITINLLGMRQTVT
ncbi:hypothetical protein [Enterocloster lavalensis]|uniref:hypothetical protein n=1 Tax=Enterocloster lavalensis TaxID=460384 RepID=UPI0034A3DF9C